MKPIAEQTIVITGASSGIGRQTALQAGEQGARVVLAARNEEALRHAAAEVEHAGGQAEVVVTDVAEAEQVDRLAQRARERFGGFDTWVNNAAISEFALVKDMTPEEMERIVRVNLLGQMYGAHAALPELERRGGGVIVFVSSALGRAPVPLQSAYVATKHGVVGFAQSLQQELEHENSPVKVSRVLPPSVNTPFFLHARSKVGVRPRPVPPVYDPGVIADSILHTAEHPHAEITVGAAAKQLELLGRLVPGIGERLLGSTPAGFAGQTTDTPDDGRDNLFSPSFGDTIRGPFDTLVQKHSPYTKLFEHNPAARAGEAVRGAVGAALKRR